MNTPPDLPIVPAPTEPTRLADVLPAPPRARNRGLAFGTAFAVFSVLFLAAGGTFLITTAETPAAAPAPSPSPSSTCGGYAVDATSGAVVCATSGNGSVVNTPPPAPTTAAAPPPPKPAAPHKAITDRQWLLIAKDPEAHAGERIVVHGLVTQFDAATGTDTFRGNVGGKKRKPSYGYVDYETNTILTGETPQLAKVVEDDLFTAKVTVLGAFDYETQLGGGTTAPLLQIDSITVTGSVA
ncbi:hypothetical protein RB614_39195 [Phytohabitans sp. ZYX-F-186]|uniref:Uncharacterized protein n=1 Tax=Phytohabitans maris TaxID=3071409 RepID=A0ABU0ZW37_9ACTN|nr:hypothetical protein [Phytohabitans sp. ZYX-F-186]MDQ7910539.1 hypothetical protein [Phytohabitans sp. ZYX-F-186]